MNKIIYEKVKLQFLPYLIGNIIIFNLNKFLHIKKIKRFFSQPRSKINIIIKGLQNILLSNKNSLRGSATQNCLIFRFCFFMLKMKLYVCRNLCENFRQIGQKMKML